MKICAAQFSPKAGNIKRNLSSHIELINLAIENDIDLIIFPELSLTGYEPALANKLSELNYESQLDKLQSISDKQNIVISAGMPIKSPRGTLISQLVFQPNEARKVYSKQLLHEDECPYFVAAENQILVAHDNLLLAPAICFESLQKEHAQTAYDLGAKVYLASVAKPSAGVEKAYKHYPTIAKKYSMIVLMANCYGNCDDFLSIGRSAVWNNNGDLLGSLGDDKDGLIGIDTITGSLVLWGDETPKSGVG